MSLGSRHNIVSDISTALKNCRRRFGLAWAFLGCSEGTFAQFLKLCIRGGRLGIQFFNDFRNAVYRTELKNNGVSQVAFTVRRLLDVVAFVDHLIFEPEALLRLLEEQKALAVERVVCDRGVAFLHCHWANLAFAEIFKGTIRTQPVGVSMLQAFFAGDDNDQCMFGGRNDATLLLATKSCVYFPAPVVNPPALKSPAHTFRISPNRAA
jgi:hypothetical protein